MRHYVDIVTHAHGGYTFIHRTRHPDRDAALAEARRLAELAFGEQLQPEHRLEAGHSPPFINDLGERVYVHAVSFGDAAQVREGRFAI